MRRLIAVFSAALFVFAAACQAQDNATIATTKTPKWSGNYSAAFGNRYVGTTVCATFANQAVFQHSLTIARTDEKTSIAGTVWNSTGVTPSTWFTTYASETDIDFNVDRRFGKYDVGVGGWMFFLEPGAKTNVPVFDAKIARDLVLGRNTVTPFTETQWYGTTNAKDAGYHGGVYPMLGVTYSRPLTERVSLSSQFHANYDASGGFGKTKGKSMFSVEAALRFVMNSSVTLTAHAGLVGSFNDPARGSYEGRPRVPVFNVGISKSF